MTLTNKSTNATITSNNKLFLSNLASEVSRIVLMNTRESNAGNGLNADINVSVDNFKTYQSVNYYTWIGNASSNWNTTDLNFSTDGSNSVVYVENNAVEFTSASSVKTVNVESSVDIGNNSIKILSDGYTFSGAGSITGSGSLNIDNGTGTTNLNITNSQSGGVNLLSGTLQVTKAESGAFFKMSNGTRLNLNPEANFTKQISGEGTITINTLATKYYSGAIKNASTVNLILGVSGSLSSSNWTSQVTSIMPINAKVNVTTTLGSAAYAVTDASLEKSKVNLGDNIRLLKSYNQNSSTPYSNILVGELSGSSSSRIEGGFVSGRTLYYSIGGLNTDATFNGAIKNYRSDAGDFLGIFKVGNGTWTLNGNSTAFTNGSFNVNAGKVVLNGSIDGANVPVTIAAGAKLTVTGLLKAKNLVINSDANGTGTLVNTGTVTLTNPATVNQYLPSARNWYISAPIAGATVPAGSTYYYYDETQKIEDIDGDHWIPVTEGTALVVGKGYIAQPGAATTLTFSGLLNDGDKSIVLTRQGATSKGFNLVGNPYPSYLDAAALLSANRPEGAEKIENNIWYRTRSGSSYQFQTYNATGDESVPQAANASYIHPMQSFWVRALADNVELNFTNAMRKHNETLSPILLRAKATSERQRLRLLVNNGTTTDEALIYFDANASNAFDRYDAPKFAEKNTVTQIFTTAGNEKLVINGMNSIPLDTPIGLGFVPGNATSFSIKANEVTNLPSDVRVILKDNTNGLETDLTDGVTTYEFAPATTTGDRFNIIFRSPNLSTGFSNTDKTDVSVYVNDNKQIVISAPANSSYAIYNVLGQAIGTGISTHSTLLTPCYNAGIYVVSVNNITRKVIIE